MDNDRVMIHVHLCVILIIGYFLFIIGAIKSDVKVFRIENLQSTACRNSCHC